MNDELKVMNIEIRTMGGRADLKKMLREIEERLDEFSDEGRQNAHSDGDWDWTITDGNGTPVNIPAITMTHFYRIVKKAEGFLFKDVGQIVTFETRFPNVYEKYIIRATKPVYLYTIKYLFTVLATPGSSEFNHQKNLRMKELEEKE